MRKKIMPLLVALTIIVATACNKTTVNVNTTPTNPTGPITPTYTPPADSVLSLIIGQVTLGEVDINGNTTNTIQQRRVLQTPYTSGPMSLMYKFYGTTSAEILLEIRDHATNTTLISRAYGVSVPTPTGSLQLGTTIPKGLYIVTITINYIGKNGKSWAYPFQVY